MNIQSAIDYGLFVQFVANTWNNNGIATNLDGRPVVNTSNIPIVAGKKYTVAHTIYACDLATDLDPKNTNLKQWTTIGIVALNDADSNDVVIAIRGTLTVWEWVQDAKFMLKSFNRVAGSGLTEDGFTDMYYSFSFSPTAPTIDFVTNLLGLGYVQPTASITVAGHSLGAALATLAAFDIAANTAMPTTLYTLASPRVGDHTFSQVFSHVVPNAFRVCNRLDIVPKVPPPLMYYHVGDETELVPSGDLKYDLGCEHHLTSYFNMLGALSGQVATYPIQPNCLKGSTAPAPAIDV